MTDKAKARIDQLKETVQARANQLSKMAALEPKPGTSAHEVWRDVMSCLHAEIMGDDDDHLPQRFE